jgi:hypothetical protein
MVLTDSIQSQDPYSIVSAVDSILLYARSSDCILLIPQAIEIVDSEV